MAYPADFPRTIVIRARRDTAALVIGAAAATFALANVIHTHHPAAALAHLAQPEELPKQGWTGELSDLPETQARAPEMAFTSASLVVPRSELALPHMPVRALVKIRGCEGSTCVAKSSAQTSSRRSSTPANGNDRVERVAVAADRAPAPVRAVAESNLPRAKSTFMSKINPLNHLPDVATIKRPFASASETVSHWFNRF